MHIDNAVVTSLSDTSEMAYPMFENNRGFDLCKVQRQFFSYFLPEPIECSMSV